MKFALILRIVKYQKLFPLASIKMQNCSGFLKEKPSITSEN